MKAGAICRLASVEQCASYLSPHEKTVLMLLLASPAFLLIHSLASMHASMSAAALPGCPWPLQAPDSALLAQVGGMGPVANSALSEVLEPAVAAAMKPYEGVAVPESERIEQNADELESLFRCAGSACRSSRWC
jgi:hypothetical protein